MVAHSGLPLFAGSLLVSLCGGQLSAGGQLEKSNVGKVRRRLALLWSDEELAIHWFRIWFGVCCRLSRVVN